MKLDQPLTDSAGSGLTPRRGPGSFWITAAIYTLVMIGGSLPIPLWHTWATAFGFGDFFTTVAFGVYAIGAVTALTVLSSASDLIGRRPVLLIGLALAVASSVLLATASGSGTVLVARLLSGLGAGLVTSTASAGLAELAGPHRAALASTVATISNMGGLGAGIIIAAAVVQAGGESVSTVRWLYVGYLAAVLAVTALLPRVTETVPDAAWKRFSWRVRRPVVPADPTERQVFAWSAVAVFVAFAVAGLFSSLVPAFVREQIKLTAPLPTGLIVATLFGAALAVQLIPASRLPEKPYFFGGALAGGIAACEWALLQGQLWPFILGTTIAGSGFGLAFRHGLRIAQRFAPVGRRADLISTYLLCAYVGNVLPTLGLGLLSQLAGSRTASMSLSGAIAAGAVVTAFALQRGPKPASS